MMKLVTEMVKMSWLNGSMATRPCCGQTEEERKKERQTDGRAVFQFHGISEICPFPVIVSCCQCLTSAPFVFVSIATDCG